MMDIRLLQDIKNNWRNCNSASTGFLASVPVEQLHAKSFDPRFTSFSYEVACIVRARLVYIDALKTGKADFSDRSGIPSKGDLQGRPKSQLLDMLGQTSNDILAEIDEIKETVGINFMQWLLQHERIHHGKLVLYLSQANLALPGSFVNTWGESNFTRKQEQIDE